MADSRTVQEEQAVGVGREGGRQRRVESSVGGVREGGAAASHKTTKLRQQGAPKARWCSTGWPTPASSSCQTRYRDRSSRMDACSSTCKVQQRQATHMLIAGIGTAASPSAVRRKATCSCSSFARSVAMTCAAREVVQQLAQPDQSQSSSHVLWLSLELQCISGRAADPIRPRGVVGARQPRENSKVRKLGREKWKCAPAPGQSGWPSCRRWHPGRRPCTAKG